MFVQLMDARTRRSLNLEHHWSGAATFVIEQGGGADAVEARTDDLVEAFPVPDDYDLGPGDQTRVQKRLDRQLVNPRAAPNFSRGPSTATPIK